jgi:hypothetical protein
MIRLTKPILTRNAPFEQDLSMLRTDQNAVPRVIPLTPPYAPDLQAVFDKIMPPGVTPLTLFTTLARVPRIWDRFRAGSLLDRGPVPLRHREIVIDRTCARCGCDYEWGVHVASFADRGSPNARAGTRDRMGRRQ